MNNIRSFVKNEIKILKDKIRKMTIKEIIKKVFIYLLMLLFIAFFISTIVFYSYKLIDTLNDNFSFNSPEYDIESFEQMYFLMEGIPYIAKVNGSGSDSIEKKIFDNAYEIQINYGNKKFTAIDLDELIDIEFQNLISREIPKYSFSNEYFSLLYDDDKTFKIIIDRIDSLEVSKAAYHSREAKKILSFVDNNMDTGKKIYTHLYFSKHFFNILDHDSIFNKTMMVVNKILREDRYKLPSQVDPVTGIINSPHVEFERINQINYFTMIGDFCQSIDLSCNAILAYKQAYEIAQSGKLPHEMAVIETKIAILYSFLPNGDYSERGILHYKNAAFLWSFTDDVNGEALSQQKAIDKICWLILDGKRNTTNYDLEMIKKTLSEGLSSTFGRSFKKEDYYLYHALGIFCEGIGYSRDIHVSATYYKLASIAALRGVKDNYDIGNICTSLCWVAYDYAILRDEKRAIHFSDLAIQFANKTKDKHYKSFYIFQKANILRILGKYREGLTSISNEFKKFPVSEYNYRGNYIAYLIYNDLYMKNSSKNYKDSADVFLKRYNNFYSNTISEFESLKAAEPKSIFSHYQELIEENGKTKRALMSISLSSFSIIFWPCIVIIILIISSYRLKKQKRKIGVEKQQITDLSVKLQQDKIELNALKENSDIHSAISRVLTRCLSHNIGSHVLSKFLDKDQVTVIDIKNQYKSILPSPFDSTIKPGKEQSALIGNFNEYLKYRMDFLADIATTTEPVMESPMYLMRDIVSGFDKNRILLNRISGVNPEIKFELKVLFNGEVISSYENQNDPLLSITNDILGAQAFYIILENIIRNIFKHGKPKSDFEIIIDVNHAALNKAFYEVEIYDTIYKSKSRIDDVVLKRNTTFNESILAKEFKLRNYNLGSIEMSVCSAYLRCLPVDSFIKNAKFKIDTASPSQDPDNSLIYAYSHCHDKGADLQPSENRYSLGYKFFISKPKQVLVVSDSEFILTEEKVDLMEKGILVVKPEQINENFVSNHQFIYFNDGVRDNITDKFPSQLPKRKVNFTDAIKTDTTENFIASLWHLYMQENYSTHKGINFKYYKYDIARLDLNSNLGDEKDFKVFIDHHHEHWGQPEVKECDYYDMACGHSKIFKLISTPSWNKNNSIYEYTENVFTQIIVIDERIQQNIVNLPGKMYSDRVPFYDYFYQQKIFIPRQEEVDLNLASFGQLDDHQKSVANDIKAFIQNHINDATFCVIHLGILEKMLPSGTDKTDIKIDPIIRQLFLNDDQRRKLIISSGRGGALNVPSDLSFVPLAMLQHSLETLFDKFVLTKLLYNSRKCK